MIRLWTNSTCPFRTSTALMTRRTFPLVHSSSASALIPTRSLSQQPHSSTLLLLRRSCHYFTPRLLHHQRRSLIPTTTHALGTLMLIPLTTTTSTTKRANKKQTESALDAMMGEDTEDAMEPSGMKRFIKRVVQFLDEWMLEPLLTLRRFLHIIVLFAPVILTAPALVLGTDVTDEDTTGSLWWYRLMATRMEKAGPSFIKLAQWIASRTDLFPMALCTILSKLHSNVDPHSFSYTKKVLEAAFGRSLDDIFLEFDREPLGVGAIAQVYKAKLRPEIVMTRADIRNDFMVDERVATMDCITTVDQDTGRQIDVLTSVAIKVIHPKARQIVHRDLKIMITFATILDWIPTMHWLSLPDEVRVFGSMMKDQLDLRIEGQHLERFNDYFQYDSQIRFPKPFMYFSSKDILVEEYEKGVPLGVFLQQAAILKRKQQQGDPSADDGGVFDQKIASIGLNAFLYMLIVYNFVHADLHPGNIMIRFSKPSAYHPFQIAWSKLWNRELKDDGDVAVERVLAMQNDFDKFQKVLNDLDQEGYVPQLVMIDTGLVNELNETNRRNFLDLFAAVAKFDGYRVGQLMVERCQSPQQVIQPELFALRMQNLILGLKQHTFHLGAIKIGSLLSEVRHMVRSHHVKLEGDFINVVVGIMLLEGIGRQLDPNLDLFKNALPVLRKYSIQNGGKNTIEGMKDVQEHGFMSPHWIKVWIFLELRSWLVRNTRENEWLKLCDILCFNN